MHRWITLVCCCVAAPAMAAPATGKDRQMLLDVQPMAAPSPVFKYQLWPDIADMQPGNAVASYLKCFAEQYNFYFSKASVDERDRLLNCPLTDIKPGSLKGYGGWSLKTADMAARMETCDWNTLRLLREHGYMLLIPEVQQMRLLSYALRVRCRGEIVDKDYPGAITTITTMLSMARHMGDHPTIISGLVGAAIGGEAMSLIEELIQQPDAPNLYWALTALPTQIVDLRKSVSAERVIAEMSFGGLADAKRAWTSDDIAMAMKKMAEFSQVMELTLDDRTAAEGWMRSRIKDQEWLATTRKTLIADGYHAETVGKYPPEQVIFMHLLVRSRRQTDEALKWMFVPYWEAEPAFADLQKPATDIEDKITRTMVFAVPKVRTAHVRLEQRRDLLRVAEAIRLDAAKNGGKLPEKLSDVSVPLPNDPVTGKPFAYKRDGLTGLLEGKTTTMKYGYEIRLRK